MTRDALPRPGDLVRLDPDTTPLRVLSVRPGAPGWAYLTGTPSGTDTAPQTRYVPLSRIRIVEEA